MANPVLSAMVDSFPDSIKGIGNQISQLGDKLNSTQQEKDALIQSMEEIHQEVIDELTPQCDYLYKGPNFYTGTGEGSIVSNLNDWRGFNEVDSPVDGQTYFDISVDPPEEKEYGNIAPAETFDAYEEVTSSMDSTITNSKKADFDFMVDYIHKPVIEMDGFYGLNDKISQLNNAKAMLLKDKAKYTDAMSTLGGYI